MSKLSISSTISLNSGHKMPLLGLGVYQARGDECRDAVSTALRLGYKMSEFRKWRYADRQSTRRRHTTMKTVSHPDIVLANRQEVGKALSTSGLPRDSIFVTTKFMPGHDVPKSDDVYAQLRRSLPRLMPETPHDEAYVDLMLIHAPRPNAEARTAEWKAFAKGNKEGWLRSIGVSNFGVAHLKALPDPVPAVNQIELHPWCQQRDIVAYCKEKGIAVQAYCPLVRAQRADDPVLDRIAKKYGKTWAQILIRWSLQKGYSPQVKSVHEWRIQENAEVYDFELADEDMAELDDCDLGAEGACSWNPVDTP